MFHNNLFPRNNNKINLRNHRMYHLPLLHKTKY
uniref:Uncharacterized protein n=1 Tax=Siphoviridae sp. ctxc31 TaxID=2826520 RepID=A0A8S5MMY8_9CAUD|nr:MAG TPA: hypothetical protein [Siphoviridae sp. ctxc31]